MAKVAFQSVDDYISLQPKAAQDVLWQLRGVIRKAVPEAEEGIAYRMPAYKLQGAPLLFFAGWKRHYSLYPAGQRLVTAFQDDLAPYEITKGTIRFPLSEPVPAKLIERIVRFRVREVTAREKVKAR